jgi:hypothetical protein
VGACGPHVRLADLREDPMLRGERGHRVHEPVERPPAHTDRYEDVHDAPNRALRQGQREDERSACSRAAL